MIGNIEMFSNLDESVKSKVTIGTETKSLSWEKEDSTF